MKQLFFTIDNWLDKHIVNIFFWTAMAVTMIVLAVNGYISACCCGI